MADSCYEQAQIIISRRTRTSQDVLSGVYSHSIPPSHPRIRRHRRPWSIHERLVWVYIEGQVVPNTIDVRVVCTAWHLVPAASVATQRQHRHRPHRKEYTYSSNDSVLEFGVGPTVQPAVCTRTLNRVFNAHQRYMTARG